jgi:acyl-CoA thioester hydrolase
MDHVTHKGCVYPWQCDHMGHMNIMWYVGKFDEANWNLFAHLRMTPGWLREQQRGMAAVEQKISYKKELMAGDVIEIRSRILEVGEKSLRFIHEMRNAVSGEVAAVCEFVGVHLDRSKRKACRFPEQVRERARADIAATARSTDPRGHSA